MKYNRLAAKIRHILLKREHLRNALRPIGAETTVSIIGNQKIPRCRHNGQAYYGNYES